MAFPAKLVVLGLLSTLLACTGELVANPGDAMVLDSRSPGLDARVDDADALEDASTADAITDAGVDASTDSGPSDDAPCGICTNLEGRVEYDVASAYSPTSRAELSNPANEGRVALLSGTFDLTDITLAPNQTLVPSGGGISGTDIDLNGATIVLNGEQAFVPTARFAQLYEGGCLSPELFGAAAAMNDAAAIEAMLRNGQQGINEPGATYNVDSPSSYEGRRTFQWNGNGATLEVNTDFGGRVFLFHFNGIRPEVCDLEIDGNDLLAFGISIEHTDFYFDGLHLHNLRGDEGESCLGISFDLYTAEATDVRILNSNFHHFDGVADGNPSGAAGVVRSLIIWYREVDEPCDILIRNTSMSSNYGKGEGIHLFNAGNQDFDNDVDVLVDNCDFWDNTRRDIKTQMSGLRVRNSRFTQIASDSPNLINVRPTANISFALDDTPDARDYHLGAELTNNVFSCETTPNSTFVGLTHVRDIVVSGNEFNFPEASVHGAVLVQEKHFNNLIEDNDFVNSGIVVGVMGDDGVTTVRNNRFVYTVTGSPQSAVIRSSLSNGVYQNLVFEDNDIQIDFAKRARNFYGIYGAHIASQRHANVTIRNNTIAYTGTPADQKFMVVAGNFGPSNTLANNTCTGITAGGALNISGDTGFTNTNNVDGSGNPLTIAP